MRNSIIVYIALLWSYSGFAQPYLSVRGDFSIDQRRGCRDLLITVTNINPGTDVILYQYEGRASTVTSASTHNYSATGNYWLYQYIQGPTGQKVDSIFVEILDPVPADFNLRSCNNLRVNIDLLTNNYDSYQVDYGDGTVITVPSGNFVPVYTYAVAGTYTLSVTGLYTTANNSCGTVSKNFTALNQVLPASLDSLLIFGGNDIRINYTLPPNTETYLEVALNNNSSFQTFKQLPQGTITDTLPDLQLPTNVYCFRIASIDACSNFKAYSNELCSVSLDATPVSDANNLTWNTIYSTNHNNINILRDSLSIMTSAAQPLAYTDSTVTCNTTYCYVVRSINSDGSVSISENICADAFSTGTPAPITNVSVTINSNQATWTWLTPANETPGLFNLYDQNGSLLVSTDQNSASFTVDLLNPDCLTWTFTNSCGNTSPANTPLCPLVLNYSSNPNGDVNLFWNQFSGWAGGITEYFLVIYDQQMNVIDSLSVGTLNTYTHPLPADNNQVNLYRIYAVPNDTANRNTISNLLYVERPPIIGIPSSFTPNGDGLNDLFSITGKYIDTIEITIFNRWGSIIYYTPNNQWDGTIKGKKVASGPYVYRVNVKDFTGKEHIRTGTVVILKD